jgi:hypothetical protein
MDQAVVNWTAVGSMAGLHSLERWGSRVTSWTQVILPSRAEAQVPVVDVRAACDRVHLQVADAGHWRELRDSATELRFLVLHAERLVEATRREYGDSREVGVAMNALDRVRRDLREVAPAPRHPYAFGASFVETRNTLYDAIWHLRYGLLVLGWARLEQPREVASSR